MLPSLRGRSAGVRIAVLAAALVTAAGAALVLALPAQAAAGCSVTYTTSDWTSSPGQGGFSANITIQNLGDPLTSWTLRFTLPNGQVIQLPGWSATWAQSGGNVTATNLSWNGGLGTGQSTQIGFNGTWTGSNPKPTSFTLNDVVCTGAVTTTTPPANTPPTVALTSPASGASFTAPATINLAATAADADGTVQRVEFYSGATLLGTDTSSPYSFSWTSVPAGAYSLTARAFDNAGASTTSTAVPVSVISVTDQIPRLSITSPTPQTTFTAPATVTMNVTATAPAGRTIARVDMSFGSMSGSDTTAPYSVTFTNVPAGLYPMSARATDNTGAIGVLDPLVITVSGGTSGAAPALHVSGNRILTAAGTPYRLLGVNRSGGEFACIQGNGMWDGPMDQASITAMRSWKVRAVRVPLNEECWLGTSSVPSTGASGATYQQNVRTYVNLLVSNGITPIVEMHWNFGAYGGAGAGCSEAIARCQKPMPDAQNAPAFWTSVANAFKGNDAVVLDLFNEPFPDIPAGNVDAGWRCFRDGGSCPGISYQVAGFQSLVNAVRATGATNIIMVGGLTWSNNIAAWLQWRPSDPLNNLVAFAHVYNFNACVSGSCWDSQWAPVAAQVPLTISEIGENDCGHSFVDQVMGWADAHGVGYLGWTWNTWPCTSGPALITDYNGTATAFGQGLKDHLSAVSN